MLITKKREDRCQPQNQEIEEGVIPKSYGEPVQETACAAPEDIPEGAARGEEQQARTERGRKNRNGRTGKPAEEEACEDRQH